MYPMATSVLHVGSSSSPAQKWFLSLPGLALRPYWSRPNACWRIWSCFGVSVSGVIFVCWNFAKRNQVKGFGQFEYRRRRVVKESGAYQIFLGGAARAYGLVTYNGGTGFEGLGFYGNVFQNGIRAKYTGVAKARAYVNLAVSKDVEAAARHYCTWRGRCACPCSVSVA